MKQNFLKILIFAVAGFALASCSNPSKMASNADLVTVQCKPEVLEVVAGKIKVEVTVNFPDKYFHPKAILEMVPAIEFEGKAIDGTPFYFQGEKVTENHRMVPVTGGAYTIPMVFNYEKGMEKSILAMHGVVRYKTKEYYFPHHIKVADGANTTYMMVKKAGDLAFAPDAYQPIINEKNESQINFLVNSAAVRPAQLKTDHIKAFEDFLAKVQQDERRVITKTEIVAYASPEGAVDFNNKLSQKRAESADKTFKNTITKKTPVDAPVDVVSVGEDWAGFQEMVKNSDIADKALILRVLEMYSDPMVREREIRNMSKVYTILADEVLPQLRRARFIANIEFTNYSDEELVEFVNNNIDILDEEALLHAATLIENNDVKIKVYNQAIKEYGSDRAQHNLAVAYLNANNISEAKKAINKVSTKNCYYYNTLGVIALREEKLADAGQHFAKSKLNEAKYNTAILDILNGDYNSAVKKLDGSGNCNEGLALILTNQLDKALKTIHDCPRSNYLKAIIAARKGNTNDYNKAMSVVNQNASLKARAEKDIEFAKFR